MPKRYKVHTEWLAFKTFLIFVFFYRFRVETEDKKHFYSIYLTRFYFI